MWRFLSIVLSTKTVFTRDGSGTFHRERFVDAIKPSSFYTVRFSAANDKYEQISFCQLPDHYSPVKSRDLVIMERRRVLLLSLLYLKRKKSQRKVKERKYWVHPILQVGYVEGAFYILFDKLQSDEIKFFNYFRMTTTTFHYLLGQLEATIQHRNTVMRESIPPKERLALTLR